MKGRVIAAALGAKPNCAGGGLYQVASMAAHSGRQSAGGHSLVATCFEQA